MTLSQTQYTIGREKDRKEEWILYTDGASSAKGSGAGLVLISPTKTEYTYAEFFEKPSHKPKSVGGQNLEEIQEKEDTTPSEITSNIPQEEGFEPPQEEVIPIRRSERTHRAPKPLPNRLV
ncbi:hypothetical protein Tco_0588088 [Tanacetum coccineum]